MPANDMDGALRRVLKPAAGGVAGCDPELNAAYAEGRLRGAERQKLEAHLAACGDCRRLVTEWMEETAAVVAPAPGRVWWHWRWAVPALAGMAIVGSVVYLREPPPKPAEPVRQVAAALPAQNEAKELVKEKEAPSPPAAKRERAARAAKPVAVPSAPPAPPAPTPVGEVAPAASELRQVGAAALSRRRDELAPQPLPDGSPARSSYRRGPTLWAVSQSGGLFRSTDGGARWQSVEHPASAPLVRVDWDAQQDLLVVEDKDGRSYRVRP
jgi:hypothetical protein